jgi:hypothetical protein
MNILILGTTCPNGRILVDEALKQGIGYIFSRQSLMLYYGPYYTLVVY